MRLKLLVFLFIFTSSAAFADSSDTYNIRFDPVGLIVGAVGVNLDIAISDSWTLGPELQYWHLKTDAPAGFTSDYTIDSYSIGARANWFLNGVYTSSFYIGPSLKYTNVNLSVDDSGGTDTGKVSVVVAECLFGYGWFWDSFNMMLGAGGSTSLGSTDVSVKDSEGNTSSTHVASISGFDLEFSLGWKF